MLVPDNGEITEEARDAAVLVIGAGAVGIALALTLARQGVRVTLLEAGPRRPRADYAADNDAICTGRPHLGLRDGRMKALGGTTRLWGGQLAAFTREDLEGDPGAGRPRWPLAYTEYLHWIDKAFDFLDAPVALRATDVLREERTSVPGGLSESLSLRATLWLPQTDFVVRYGNELASLANLTVITECAVTRLRFADGTVREAETAKGLFRGRQVVLACGTFEIARLLLQSAAIEPDCGFAANLHIGKWYIDHLHGVAGEIVEVRDDRIGQIFDNLHVGGYKVGAKLCLAQGHRVGPGLVNGAATINGRMRLREGVAELRTIAARLMGTKGRGGGADLRQIMTLLRILAPLIWRYLRHRRSGSVLSRGVSLGVELEQLPTPDSYLFLDPAEPPETARIGLHWALDGRELQTVQALVREVQQAFAREGLGRVVPDPLLAAGDPAFVETMHDSYHQMGGARMAEDCENGVVDPQLKVFGTRNLFVLGAATFPSGSYANPTLSALALAMRLGEHLISSRPPV